MHRSRLVPVPGQIGLLRREAEHRGEPPHGGAEDLLDDRQAGLAGNGGDRLAVKSILADVEIEGREIDRHELVERREDALEIKFRIVLAHAVVEFAQAMEDVSFEAWHVRISDAILLAEV